MKKLIFLFTMFIATIGVAQSVYIPDTAFKTYLLSVSQINLNNDSEISIEEAAQYSGVLNVSNLGIYDLTGIEAFTSLIMLQCASNYLTSLDVRNNINLDHLECQYNNLSSLDLSSMDWLRVLNCSNNNLSSLSISRRLADLTAINNPNLFCICIDDITAAWWTSPEYIDEHMSFDTDCSNPNISFSADKRNGYMPHTVQFSCVPVNGTSYLWNFGDDSLSNVANPVHTYIKEGVYTVSLEITVDSQVQTLTKENYIKVFKNDSVNFVNIPDAIFKDYLVNNEDINLNGDNDISYEEAANYTGVIWGTDHVFDYTGIEAFINIYKLYILNNRLKELDVSKNVALTELHCGNCNLTHLDISNNIALTKLGCENNKLSELDVSNNIELKELDCQSNRLTNLDLRNNHALSRLWCKNNDLSILDIRNTVIHTDPYGLKTWGNQNLQCISVDDLSWTTNLYRDYDWIDPHTTFNNNCAENYLQAIFLADNTLAQIPVTVNFINQSSGGNDLYFKWNFGDSITSEEVNPTHVYTKNGAYTITLTTSKDNNSNTRTKTNYIIALEAPNDYVNIPDNNFKNLLVNNDEINLNFDEEITYTEGAIYKANINVSNEKISDLTGIETFLSIEELNCSYNDFTSLDLSKNTALIYLNCENSNLNSLDLRNTMLKTKNSLYVQNNPNLSCISVDDPIWANENWTVINGNIDSQITFSCDCQNSTQINDLSSNVEYLKIFPNPNNGVFSIVLQKTMIVSVYSQLGVKVFEKQYTEGEHIIDLSEFRDGLFILKASYKNIELHQLLIKL